MIQLLADTNVFLRFLLKDNSQQYEHATKVFKKAKRKELDIAVPQIIIFEICFALEKYYEFPKNQVVEKLKAIVSANYFQIQDREIFSKALDLYRLSNVSIVDCFLAIKAQVLGMDIFTFDKDLEKLLLNLDKHN